MPPEALPDTIYHLALEAEWAEAVAGDGRYRRSTLGRSLEEVGFVHCSFAHQVDPTAERFYAGRTDVVLLTIATARLDAPVRVEPAAGGTERFPHIYGPVAVGAVDAVERLSPRRGREPS